MAARQENEQEQHDEEPWQTVQYSGKRLRATKEGVPLNEDATSGEPTEHGGEPRIPGREGPGDQGSHKKRPKLGFGDVNKLVDSLLTEYDDTPKDSERGRTIREALGVLGIDLASDQEEEEEDQDSAANPGTEEGTDGLNSNPKVSKGGREVKRRRVKATVVRMAKARRSPRKRSRIPKATSESERDEAGSEKSGGDNDFDEEDCVVGNAGSRAGRTGVVGGGAVDGDGTPGSSEEEDVGGAGEAGDGQGGKEGGEGSADAGGGSVSVTGGGRHAAQVSQKLDRERRRLESVLEPGLVATSGDKVARRLAAGKKGSKEGERSGVRVDEQQEEALGGKRKRGRSKASTGGKSDATGGVQQKREPIVVDDDSVEDGNEQRGTGGAWSPSRKHDEEETVGKVGVAVMQDQIPKTDWIIRESGSGGFKRRPMWFRRMMRVQRRVRNVSWDDLVGLPTEVVMEVISSTATQFGEPMGVTRASPKRQRMALLRRAFLLSPMAPLPSGGVTWHTKDSLAACNIRSLRETLGMAGFSKDMPEHRVVKVLWRVMGDVAEDEITVELASMGLERPVEPGTLSDESGGAGKGEGGVKGGALGVHSGTAQKQSERVVGKEQQAGSHGGPGDGEEGGAGVVTDVELECALQELNLHDADDTSSGPFWEWWQDRRFAMAAPCSTWASWGIDELAAFALSHGKSEVQVTTSTSGKQRFVVHVRKEKATRKNLIFFCSTILFQRQRMSYAGQLPSPYQAVPELERTFRCPVQAVRGRLTKVVTPFEKLRQATLLTAQLETVSASTLATIAKVKGILGGDALHEMIAQAERGDISGELVFEAYDQLLRDIVASDAEQKNRQLTLGEVMGYPLNELRRRAQDRAVPNAATMSTSALRKALMSPPRSSAPSTAPSTDTRPEFRESEEVRRLRAALAEAEEKAKAMGIAAQHVQQRATEEQPRRVPLVNPTLVGRSTQQPAAAQSFTAGLQRDRMQAAGGPQQGPCQYCRAADHAQEACPIATSRDALNRDKKRGAFKTTLLRQPASKSAVPLPEGYRKGTMPKPVSEDVWASARLDPDLTHIISTEQVRALVDELCELDDEAFDFREWTVPEPKVYVKAFWKWAPLTDSEFSMLSHNSSVARPANPMWVICEASEPHEPIEWFGRAGEESGIWAWVIPMRNLQGWPGEMRFSQRQKFTEVRDGAILPIQPDEGDECFEGWIPKPRIGIRGATPEKIRATIDPAIGILRDLSASVFTNPRVFNKTSFCDVVDAIGATLKRLMGLQRVTLYDRGAGIGEMQHQLRRLGSELNLVAMEWMPQDPAAEVERVDSYTLGRREVLERGEGFAIENMNFREQARRNKQAETMGLMMVGGITGAEAPTEIAGGKVVLEIPIGFNMFVTEGAQQPTSVDSKLWLWARNDVLEAARAAAREHNQAFWKRYKKEHGLSSTRAAPEQPKHGEQGVGQGVDREEEHRSDEEEGGEQGSGYGSEDQVEGDSEDERQEAWLREQMEELNQRRAKRRAGQARS